MYDDHYGLTGRPFQLTPDPRFWFDTATHRKAMAYLGYGLAQGEGFIVITGDVGAGKTTLVGHLMATVDRERLNIIKIVSTQIEADDLLRLVAGGLEVESDGLTKAQLLTAIERGLHATARAGRRTLLIVDESQALPVSSLEELRMLSNFQAGGHALLQIFLLGQPEFRERLHGSDRLEQLRQRVIAMHHLDPMGADEVEPYMVHRLSLVGWQDNPHFTPDAFRALHDATDGVPRRLNQLAGRVLLYGAIEQLQTIDRDVIDTVLADIANDTPSMAHAVIQPAAVADNGPVGLPEAPPEVSDDEPAPRPLFHTPPPSEARPIRAPLFVEPEQVAELEPEAEQVAEVAEVAAKPAPADRISALEARIEEQEEALRRVLTLLVDWVEHDPRAAAALASVGR
ncbi:general secretion pathway protein GspA [Sphingomonas sp. Leaf357]|uniref:AAA family ATPase n=1 Tax=Sphingomonas sp. Leaf357 TaxID=1736350 RepID=UPI0006FB617B|nr:AAA family ATPase [Sphingomonas sp. Leaf357]KQS01425.1 general secretion pathway protein GspA [Sphingomonas sp. Leaf357]